MSGSNSSSPTADVPATPLPPDGPVTLAVHSVPVPVTQTFPRSRWTLWLVLLVCAAPVVASYFAFYVLDLRGSAYGDLITPTRDLPPDLPLRTLSGEPVAAPTLRGQWLLTYVPDRACATDCERMLFMQRQLREMLGRERDKLDKLVLVPDDVSLSAAQIDALTQHKAPATVLRVPRAALTAWLAPASGRHMDEHLFLIDPMGRWMLRSPAQPEPMRFKKDLDRLMKANAGWDQPGR